jgi:hypothetical protein
VWGVATHEYRNHFTPWACPAPCDLSDLSGGGMVRGASHEATAYAPFSPMREEAAMEQEGGAKAIMRLTTRAETQRLVAG